MQHYVFNLIITHSNSKVQCECWQLGNTKTRLVLFQLCPLSSFTNLTGRHSKGFSLCHEESIAFNQTSPILGIGYQRLTAEITVSRLSGTWLHLLTSDQGPTPAALCVHIRLCHPHLPPHIFEWLWQNSAGLGNLFRLAAPSLCCLKWCSGFWASADTGRQEQRGCQKGRLPAFS